MESTRAELPVSSDACAVLVVEDDADVRDAVADLLELEFDGLRTVRAEHGAAALRHLADGLVPSLILLDLEMPVMGGYEFLERLGQVDEELRSVPVVVVSSVDDPDLPSNVKLLRKPVRIRAILAEVRRACFANVLPLRGAETADSSHAS